MVVGRLLIIGFLSAFLLGLIPAFIARARGKVFMDWWFLGTGISVVVLVVLYVLGTFNALLPILAGGAS